MKDKIIIVLLLIIIFLSLAIINLTKYDSKDVNKDGKISTIDYSIIKHYIIERNNKNE